MKSLKTRSDFDAQLKWAIFRAATMLEFHNRVGDSLGTRELRCKYANGASNLLDSIFGMAHAQKTRSLSYGWMAGGHKK